MMEKLAVHASPDAPAIVTVCVQAHLGMLSSPALVRDRVHGRETLTTNYKLRPARILAPFDGVMKLVRLILADRIRLSRSLRTDSKPMGQIEGCRHISSLNK